LEFFDIFFSFTSLANVLISGVFISVVFRLNPPLANYASFCLFLTLRIILFMQVWSNPNPLIWQGDSLSSCLSSHMST
jgi:uncharacterized membrane protein YczE